MVCFVASFAATLFVQRDGTSHMSHVGGLLAGAFVAPALLWFPGTAREKRGWNEAVAAAGVGAAATLLASTLAVFYLKTLPAAACKE
jgi:drug/metabolite transporter (DMT)-like permease